MGTETQSNPMQDLLDELETLAKAQEGTVDLDGDSDDEAIRRAAEEGEEGEDEDDKDKAAGEMLGKAMTAVIDGQEHEVVDGTALVKALMAEQATQGDALTKALANTLSLIKGQGALLKAQADEIALLKADLQRLGGLGAGRKSALSIHDKPGTEGASQAGETVSIDQLMVKANDAFSTGRISGRELAVVDVSVRSNVAIEPALLGKIMKP